MSTTWNMTAQAIITDALQHLGVLDASEVPTTEDNDTCLTALQNIIKELPLHGLSWHKMTVAPTSLTWSSGTPAQVSMPTDYFGEPNIYYVSNLANVDLQIINKADYDELTEPSYVALLPIKIYIAPNNIGYLWPVPSADPVLKIVYQAIGIDVVTTVRPDVVQAWQGGLGWWLACEVSHKFGISQARAAAIEKRYMEKRKMMLAWAVESAPILFGVVN